MTSGTSQPAVSLYIHPKESFALSLLYLDLGKTDLARKVSVLFFLLFFSFSFSLFLFHFLFFLLTYTIKTTKMKMVLEIEAEDLIKLCLNYSHLLNDGESDPSEKQDDDPTFSQLLRTCVPSIFLEVAVRLRYTDFPMLSILNTIKYVHPNQKDLVSSEDSMNDNTLMRLFLEK